MEHAGAHASYRESVKALLEQWEESSAAGGAGSSSARAATTTMQRDPSLSLLLPLLILLSTLLFLLIFFLIFLILVKRGRLSGRGGIALGDNDGPLDLSREEELDGEGGLRGIEQRWLEQQDEGTTAGYERAKRELPSMGVCPRACRRACRAMSTPSHMLYMRACPASVTWRETLTPSTWPAARSLPAAVPPQLDGDRHHPLPVPLDPGKGHLCLVL